MNNKSMMTRLMIASVAFAFMVQVSIAQPVLSLTGSNASEVVFSLSNLKKGCRVNVKLSSLINGFGNLNKHLRVLSVIARSKSLNSKLTLDLSSDTGKDIYAVAEQVCDRSISKSKVKILKISKSQNLSGRTTSILMQDVRAQSIIKYSRISEVTSASNRFTQPVDIQVLPGGDSYLYVVEQGGKIDRLNRSSGKRQNILDISATISKGGERGLLGLALHPKFTSNRYLYVNYTRLADGATVISRFTAAKSGRIILSSEKQILIVAQPFRNHNGGGLSFGPDGYLYIALGDGGSANDPQGNGQNRSVLLGKILRIDVDSGSKKYSIPKSNPFAGNSDGYKEEIFAYGLRNPWRISFDGQRLWVGDVGQNALEEVNIVRKGGNYGWSIKEASSCFRAVTCDGKGLRDPVNQYNRTIGTSITGGYVSRFKNSPNLDGVYIFGDFVSGRIFALEHILGKWVRTQILDTSIFISTFGIDEKGMVYMASYSDGKIYSIR